MILSNVTVPLLGIVDTAVMGHLDDPRYIGAVAVGATIFNFIFIGLNFLRMGTTGLAAQARGARDADEMRTVLAQAVLIAVGMAVMLILVQQPIGHAAMWLIRPETDVLEPAWTYFSIRVWAAPAALTNFALVGWLRWGFGCFAKGGIWRALVLRRSKPEASRSAQPPSA